MLKLYAFGFIDKIKSKDEIILDEHEKLDDKFKEKITSKSHYCY